MSLHDLYQCQLHIDDVFCLGGLSFTVIKWLDDSVWTYADRNVGEKTKQKNAQLCFAQKTLRLTKNHPGDNGLNLKNHPDGFGGASLKMAQKWIKKILKKSFVLDDKVLVWVKDWTIQQRYGILVFLLSLRM